MLVRAGGGGWVSRERGQSKREQRGGMAGQRTSAHTTCLAGCTCPAAQPPSRPAAHWEGRPPGAVHHVHQHAAALAVAQELVAQAHTRVRALQQPRHICGGRGRGQRGGRMGGRVLLQCSQQCAARMLYACAVQQHQCSAAPGALDSTAPTSDFRPIRSAYPQTRWCGSPGCRRPGWAPAW